MKPFISIIMPVFNNEKYLPAAVDSIIGQTFKDWELIIIDDGSTDGTPVIADRYAKAYGNIYAIHQLNQWIYASVNNGIELANGEYVLNVNSDDLLNGDALRHIHDIAVIDKADMVIFTKSINYCDENQCITRKTECTVRDDFSYTESTDIHKGWIRFIKRGLVTAQCVYKSSIAKANKFRNDVYGADSLYNIQIADQVKVLAGTSYEVYKFLVYQDDGMNTSFDKYYGYEHEMFNDMYSGYIQLFQKWGIYDNLAQDFLIGYRLNLLSTQNKSLIKSALPLDDKIERIITSASDELIYENAEKMGRLEELEARILSAFRNLFLNETPKVGSRYYFLYEMLYSLLMYEKEDDDMLRIERGVNHVLNPRRIGKVFLGRLRENNGNI